MKQFFDCLRRWLIKKLGGYTEQFKPIQRQIAPVANVQVQNVMAHITVDTPPPGSEVEFKRYCEDRMLGLLMQELYKSGFILWESWERQDDIFTQKVNMRATLRVVNANDLMPHFQRRVE